MAQNVFVTKRDLRLRFTGNTLADAIAVAEHALIKQQDERGFWVFEMEADCSISADYILLMHFMDEINEILQYKIANYLRGKQSIDGGYALFPEGPSDVSVTVKVYYALKLAGDLVDAEHMRAARDFILSDGTATNSNVFTRFMLAMFEQIPWRLVPYMPVEIVLLPKWFPLSLTKTAYWARVVIVPLLILQTLKAKAKNPKGIGISELFTDLKQDEELTIPDTKTLLGKLFFLLDKLGRKVDPWVPNLIRRYAIKKAQTWMRERLNGEDGLGAIFPAMLYSYLAMDALGVSKDNEEFQAARVALGKLLVAGAQQAYCQPNFSPVWDTAFSALALMESNSTSSQHSVDKALFWLTEKQLKDESGDWRQNSPSFNGGGGWSFQFNNSYYPDVDDTALVAFALGQADNPGFDYAINNALRWLEIMQSRNGGYAAFEVDNTSGYLNELPFSDYNALIDPPTADVSARCVLALASATQDSRFRKPLKDCIEFLWNEQEENGSWFGRWGTNYIYGTWSVLTALEQARIPCAHPRIRHAVVWLKSVQREDGGWGESNMSYHDPKWAGRNKSSTAFQTAWALLGLMAAGEVSSPEVEAGIDYLLATQQNDGLWVDDSFTGAGFPKMFYMKYHGYDKYFPLWALARYRRLINA